MTGRGFAGVVVAGWLANALASTDADVEAGIAAYEASEQEKALQHFDAAQERLGERPELSFDRGLALLEGEDAEGARTAFERASESDDATIRAAGFYELGNMALDAEDFDAAIAHYIDCLKARPDHSNAKWNLELAYRKKKEKEEQEQEEQEQEEKEDEGEENEDEGEENEDGGEQSGDQNEKDKEEPEEEPEEPEQEPEQPEQEPEPPEQEPEEQEGKEAPPEPQPLDRMDVQRALEELDEQDNFSLERPQAGYAQPEKDW